MMLVIKKSVHGDGHSPRSMSWRQPRPKGLRQTQLAIRLTLGCNPQGNGRRVFADQNARFIDARVQAIFWFRKKKCSEHENEIF